MSRNRNRQKNGANGNSNNDEDRLVEQWKIRKLIKRLREARGNGTSMISLIIPPSGQVSQVQNMLMQEHGTASNIKSRVNRLSVLSAITSTRERLKLYNRIPPNGLVLYCGTVITDEGKDKKMSIHFEPFKAVNNTLYMCDNKFHVEHLQALLEEDSVFGFIIMDGNGCLYGTLSGNHCVVKQKFSVELPKKHGRGGQSAVRFARLRMEARHNYVRKCAELATLNFITGDRPNVEGLVLAGSANFKMQLNKSDLFDIRLKEIVLKLVDTSYGGVNGFNQAIELSKETLTNVKFIHEKKLLADFLQEIAMDSNKYAFGIRDTMRALEMSAVKTIIVWDSLELHRYKLRNPSSKDTKEVYANEEEATQSDFLKDRNTGVLWDIVEHQEVLEWFAENYKKFGATLEFVTDRSPEGAQFVKGFGGIGAFLRWQINWAEIDDYFGIDEDDDEAWI
jgi:peptide chain release factor subunit 1